MTTVVLGSAAGPAGGLIAAAGLLGLPATGSTLVDAAASALIGLVLLAASVVLLNSNRALLTGRGVSPTLIAHMREVVAAQPGVVAAAGLRAQWPAVSYAYLNPVSTLRPRTGIITPSTLPVDRHDSPSRPQAAGGSWRVVTRRTRASAAASREVPATSPSRVSSSSASPGSNPWSTRIPMPRCT